MNGQYIANDFKASSTCIPIKSRTVWFQTMETEKLRELIKPAWPTATRAQLLAYLHNRYPCGYMIEILDGGTCMENKEFPDFKVRTI